MSWIRKTLLWTVPFICLSAGAPFAAAEERVLVTVLAASNQGTEMDLDNDAYRDEMIRLFSYSSYIQLDQKELFLKTGETSGVVLPGEYEMLLTLQGTENDRRRVHAMVRKGDTAFADMVLLIRKPGVAFLGGPPLEKGDLIIVLEMGF